VGERTSFHTGRAELIAESGQSVVITEIGADDAWDSGVGYIMSAHLLVKPGKAFCILVHVDYVYFVHCGI
jgi:hypothetical protein